MKLVDILARELKVWPADCMQDNTDGEVFFGGPVKSFWATQNAEDSQTAKVTRDQWQAAVDALKAEKAPAWSGEGLPPVGMVCEVREMRVTPANSFEDWSKCSIIAHNTGSSGDPQVCTTDDRGDFAIFYPATDGTEFRPIRTPEQIAKQERSRACDKMYGVILDRIPQDRRNNGSDICEALYDAGYRKFEIVDN